MPTIDKGLHELIAEACGNRRFARTYYGKPDPEFADMGSETLNEKRYTVADVAPAAKTKFIYEYDFGDGWQHDVVAEEKGNEIYAKA